jgi:flavin reductase (DIM6/NTAB) family NADH-FMN oxidoreductase RutF
MIFDPSKMLQQDAYKLMIGTILPRPIAWVSSISAAGVLNLAPFSFFTVGATIPMTLIFCPQIAGSGRGKKDTLRNIEEVPEFVVNITSEDTVIPMNLSATELPAELSEFEWAQVTPVPSETIRVPRVAEAPAAFECKLQRIVTISDAPGGGSAVFGEVQRIHLRDDLLEQGRVKVEVLKPIGRLAGAGYTRVTDTFDLARVPAPAPKLEE